MKLFLLLPLLIIPLALDAVHFAVKEKDRNIYCLILNANITGVLHYDNQKNTTSSVQFTVPSNEGASSPTQMDKDKSFCGPTVEKLQFDFLPDMVPPVPATEANQKWNIALEFTKNGTGPEQRYVLQSYALTVHYYTSMNASEKNDTIPHVYGQPEGHKAEWTAAANSAVPNGFSCSQNQLFLNQTDSSITFKNIKLLAFAAQPFDNFTSTQVFEQCPLDVRTSDLVPIIVGICLAGLVIVVLIAYLIGRARAKRQGYASV